MGWRQSVYACCGVMIWLLAQAACIGGNCVPQEIRDCRCLNGREGIQLCGPFGSDWSICSCGEGKDGGSADTTTDGTSRRFLKAQYRSTSSEKSFLFLETGQYKLYVTEAQRKADQPNLNSRYFVVGQEVHFERADGSAFGSVGKLSQGDGQLTWMEFPGEIFQKE